MWVLILFGLLFFPKITIAILAIYLIIDYSDFLIAVVIIAIIIAIIRKCIRK